MSPDRLQRLWSALVPGSIVARTTLAIVGLAVVLGVLFVAGAAAIVHNNERARSQARLDELLSTVESTLRIACFVKDAALAKEVATGLLSNRIVAGVRIVADNQTLYEQSVPGFELKSQDASQVKFRTIYSPFKADEAVGRIALYGSELQISRSAWSYTGFISLILALEVTLVAGGVVVVVFNLITRPIKGISDELHRLELRTGMRLRVPEGNQRDEIGRLVTDVNGLIARLSALIDEERQLREARERSERKLQLIFDKAETGIFVAAADGRLQSWNPAFARILEVSAGGPDVDIQRLLAPHGEAVERLLRESIATNGPKESDLPLPARGSDERRWIELSVNPVDSGHVQGIVNDITQRKRTEAAAERLASADPLTGLLNRRGLELTLAALFEQRRANQDVASSFAVLLVDLDGFKAVNDTHGHEAGDLLLRWVAAVLERTVRRSDVVARLGGDEFVVVLTGVADEHAAMAIGNTIVEEVAKPIEVPTGGSVSVGASIGLTLVSSTDRDGAAILRRADAAMYGAKQSGKGRVHVAGRAGESLARPAGVRPD